MEVRFKLAALTYNRSDFTKIGKSGVLKTKTQWILFQENRSLYLASKDNK